MSYHHYSAEEIEQINETSVLSFLQEQGYEFKRVGNSYRCKDHPSLAIAFDEKKWSWHSQNLHGIGVINWCMNVEKMSFPETMDKLSSKSNFVTCKAPEKPEIAKTEFKLPEKFNGNYSRAFAYLVNTRKIDKFIVNECFNNGSLYEDEKHNVIAVGFDETGKAKYATRRGTNTDIKFRGDVSGSNKRYGFTLRSQSNSSAVFVFEGFGDVLAHATLFNIKAREKAETTEQKQNAKYAYKGQNRIALGGVSDNALEEFLENNPNIRQIYFCLDNDDGGKPMTEKYMKKYSERGYEVYDKTLKKVKDYGDLLTEYIKATNTGSIGNGQTKKQENFNQVKGELLCKH